MIERRLQRELTERLRATPAVAVLGPRQIGKTTLAMNLVEGRNTTYLDLQSATDRARLDDPERYFSEHADKLVVLDEVHRVPALFETLRGSIDRNRRAGRRAGQFVVLGSASLELLRQSGETLAGRIAYLELRGVDLLELVDGGGASAGKSTGEQTGPDTSAWLRTLWTRGGFPDSLLAEDDAISLAWRRDFITTYLQRDVPDLGPRVPAETLRRFWTMLAHLSGSRLNAASLSRSLGVDATTVARYLDLLVDLLLVRRLAPWHGNVGKRLVKSPKVYVRDTGLVHALLDIPTREALLGHPKLGDSFEGFVIENLLAIVPSAAQPFWYGTGGGAEVDLVLEFPAERWAIEIKHSSAPVPSRGFHEGSRDIDAARRIIVYAGEDSYAVRDGVEVMSLVDLMRELLSRGSAT